MDRFVAFYNGLIPFFQILILLVLSIIGGQIIRLFFNAFLRLYKKSTDDEVLVESVIRNLRPVLKVLLPLILFSISFQTVEMEAGAYFFLSKLEQVLLICSFAWLFIQITDVVEDVVYHKFDVKQENNYLARKVQTQVQFIKRLLVIGIVVIAVSVILLSFEGVRTIGAGLLTSAGVTGIILGFAAQKSISNLIAGFQIAFTQPIRIDDVVVVEGEWGRIEEITFTYVVIMIWDQRRLVVPINYFIEKPFQNWTRSSADILGTIFLYTDYFVPIEAIREELKRLCEKNKYWDKRVCVLQVTELTDQSVQLRALVSAANSGNAWELRVILREQLMDFIRKNYPDSLPRTRAEITELPGNMALRPSTHQQGGKETESGR
ncbi:mechanosensitive ion channel family protein [Nafulsella turpanensis]|uniref:mechanosensitive ion channel family protein n=1 Tax=Nafulsella turpanensis TaxID=1265690 RepID=UPI00034761A4|nr:mechanosensitive ion channel domain-containing protein [Nafulsella turpanensis]